MMTPVSLSTSSAPVQMNGISGADAAGASNGAPTEPVASLMPEPQKGGDIGLMIAKMVVDNAFARRKQAREDRKEANRAMVEAQKSQIANMRAAADSRYAAARTQAWGKIAGGALGALGGAVSGVGGAFADQGGGRMACDGSGRALAADGDVAQGLAGLWASNDTLDADLADANAKADEMQATKAQDAMDAQDDLIDEARDDVRNALDFLKEFQSTETKSMSSAIRA